MFDEDEDLDCILGGTVLDMQDHRHRMTAHEGIWELYRLPH